MKTKQTEIIAFGKMAEINFWHKTRYHKHNHNNKKKTS